MSAQTINSAREAFCFFVNMKQHLGHRFVMAQHLGPTADQPDTWWIWFACKACGFRAGAVVVPSCVPGYPFITTYEPIPPCLPKTTPPTTGAGQQQPQENQ